MKKHISVLILTLLSVICFSQQVLEEKALDGYFIIRNVAYSRDGLPAKHTAVKYCKEFDLDKISVSEYINSQKWDEISFETDTSIFNHYYDRRMQNAFDINDEDIDNFRASGIPDRMTQNKKTLDLIINLLDKNLIAGDVTSLTIIKGKLTALVKHYGKTSKTYIVTWNKEKTKFKRISTVGYISNNIDISNLATVEIFATKYYVYPISMEKINLIDPDFKPSVDGNFVVKYSESDVIAIEFKIVNGQYDGVLRAFDKNGAIIKEVTYSNGKRIRKD